MFFIGLSSEKKEGIKLNTLLDLKSNTPTFIDITTAEIHDVHVLDKIVFEVGAFYIMDRGYIDYTRLYSIQRAFAFFIIRAKKNMSFNVLKSNKIDKNTGLRCNQIIRFAKPKAQIQYPLPIRRIKFVDVVTGNTYVFLTNNFEIDAQIIALLYKKRWNPESFRENCFLSGSNSI